MPLTITRRPAERFHIGKDITVTVVRVDGNQVRLSIDAPRSIPILREEVKARQEAKEA